MTVEVLAIRILIGLGLTVLGGMFLIIFIGCCSDIWTSMPWIVRRREKYYRKHPEDRPVSIEKWTSTMDEVRYEAMMSALKREAQLSKGGGKNE